MTPSEWRAMVAALDSNAAPRAKPHALRSKTSALLSGPVWCGVCDARMHRGTTNGRESYSCPRCHQMISRIQDYVVEQFLWAKGEHVRWTRVRGAYESGTAVLPENEARLDEFDAAIRDAPDREARRRLQQQDALLDLRDEKRAEAPRTELRYEDAGFFAEGGPRPRASRLSGPCWTTPWSAPRSSEGTPGAASTSPVSGSTGGTRIR